MIYVIETQVEESMEIFGISLLIYTLALYIEQFTPLLKVNIGYNQSPSALIQERGTTRSSTSTQSPTENDQKKVVKM